MPTGTDVLELDDSLDIIINWKKSKSKSNTVGLAIATIFWNVIVGIFIIGIIGSGEFAPLAIISIHALIGLGLIYHTARTFLNYTDIIVTQEFIGIYHRPIPNPFSPSVEIERSDIKQLYVSKYVSSKTNDQPNYAYALYAVQKGNDIIQLLKGMDKKTMLYLEQEIERFYRITDQKTNNQGEILS